MLSLTIDAATLLGQLAATTRFAAKPNSGIPIRDCILLTATAAGITLHASDSALGFTSSEIPAVVKATGTICVPAVTFLAAVKAIGAGAITLQEADANRMIVRGPGITYTLHGMPATDYPMRAPVAEATGLTFATSALADVITVVTPNIPGDDNRYGLNGVTVELSDGRARFVATDGNRLAWAEAATEGAMDFPAQSLISRVGVAALANLLPVAGPRVTFASSGKYLEVRTDAGVMHAQFITAEFPDYRQVLPASFKNFLTANRVDLLRAVDRVLPFAGGTIPEVLLTLPDDGDGDLTLTTRKLDSGDSLVTLAVNSSGPGMKICLNGKYVRDALVTMDCDEVTIAISGVLSPAIFVPKGSPPGPRADRLNVVMPVRVS